MPRRSKRFQINKDDSRRTEQARQREERLLRRRQQQAQQQPVQRRRQRRQPQEQEEQPHEQHEQLQEQEQQPQEQHQQLQQAEQQQQRHPQEEQRQPQEQEQLRVVVEFQIVHLPAHEQPPVEERLYFRRTPPPGPHIINTPDYHPQQPPSEQRQELRLTHPPGPHIINTPNYHPQQPPAVEQHQQDLRLTHPPGPPITDTHNHSPEQQQQPLQDDGIPALNLPPPLIPHQADFHQLGTQHERFDHWQRFILGQGHAAATPTNLFQETQSQQQQEQTTAATTAAAAASSTTEEQRHHTRTPEGETRPTTTLGRRSREESDQDEVDDQARERRARRAQEQQQAREEEERGRRRAIAARQAEEIEQFLQQPSRSARLADMENNGIDPDLEEEQVDAMSRRYADLIREQRATDQHPLLIQQRCREYRVDQRMDQRLADFGLISLARIARYIRCRNVLETLQDLIHIQRRLASTPANTENDTATQVAEQELAEHAFRLFTAQPGDRLVLRGETLTLRDEALSTMPRFRRILGRRTADEQQPRVQEQVDNRRDDEEEEGQD